MPCIAIALVISFLFSKICNISTRMASLIAVGSSICGATAILATAPIIGAKKEEIAYAVANITIFGILAMLIYPYLAHWLFNDSYAAAGLFLGTAIHETAQFGAGLITVLFGNQLVFEFLQVFQNQQPHNLIEKILIQTVGHILLFS